MKIAHDVDQRCTLRCEPGYHIECANLTAIGDDAPAYMDKLTSEQTLGRKFHMVRQDYLSV